MSLAYAFANSFLKTYTGVKQEQRKAEREAEIAKEEKRSELGKFIVENSDKFAPGADFTGIEDYTDLVPLMNTMNKIGNSFGYGDLQFQNNLQTTDNVQSIGNLTYTGTQTSTIFTSSITSVTQSNNTGSNIFGSDLDSHKHFFTGSFVTLSRWYK